MSTTYSRAYAQENDIVPKLEGMEVEFDEKVTLFPADLEEMRDVAPKSGRRATRSGRLVLH